MHTALPVWDVLCKALSFSPAEFSAKKQQRVTVLTVNRCWSFSWQSAHLEPLPQVFEKALRSCWGGASGSSDFAPS
jgi:hypothetical protein